MNTPIEQLPIDSITVGTRLRRDYGDIAALTEAAAMPAMPDPRLTRCHRIVRELKDAIRDYPNDPEVPMFESLIAQMESVIETLRERTRNADLAAD